MENLTAAEKKQLKRRNQALARKDEEDVVMEEDYSRQDSQQAAEDRAQAIFNKAEKLQVPADARLTSIVEQRDANGLLTYLLSGTARVDKNHDADVNRVIWYNELDKQHTFNYDHQRCKAASSVIGYSIAHQSEGLLTPLLKKYYLAVREQRERGPADFTWREAFIREWQGTQEDIYVFTKGEMEKYKAMKRARLQQAQQQGLFDLRREVPGDVGGEDDSSSDEEERSAERSQTAQKGTKMGDLIDELEGLSSTDSSKLPDHYFQLLEIVKNADLSPEDREEVKDGYCALVFYSTQQQLAEYKASVAATGGQEDQAVIDGIVDPAHAAIEQLVLEQGMQGLMKWAS
ncbi:hypothetical protein KC332_g11407 [Hortaea werneckii]|nr:hypothetical protein KC358_g11442 [Hortaea werneckii]KAI6816534.1 hypothetical protein KC350_g10761 [Hortaea werneckii]KAI6919981.1 hypothetical protein KC348_g10493 [Hortaea werneckii]KAI6928647.1 hypothetical protein KC341_g11376 [Hortaea werneckii]KAI6963124.1 hypothetical protein KC321_g11395 [Hortaea werneckii]